MNKETVPNFEKESKKEKILRELLEVIKKLEDSFEWGGAENSEGGLERGEPDFAQARTDIEKIISRE